MKSTDITDEQLYSVLAAQDPKKLARLNKLIECRNTRIDFANDHHFVKGKNLDFTEYPYLVKLYNSISPKIVISGGVQIGKSVALSVYMLACMQNGLHVFAVWPRKSDKENFMKASIKKIINDSPYYSKIMSNTNSPSDTVDFMYFGPGVVKAGSGETEKDFAQFDADVYVVDEADQCSDPDLIRSGTQRYENSPYKFEFYIANPKRPGSFIVKELAESTDERWQCECTNCGKFSEIDFFKTVVKEIKDKKGNLLSHSLRDTEWKIGCGRDIHIKCPHCETGNLDRTSPRNHWLITRPENKDKAEGYHMPSLISLRRDVSFIYNNYLKGLKSPAEMATFYMTNLALPYESKTGGMSEGLMKKCAVGTEFTINEENFACRTLTHPGPCSMGIDTRGVFDVRISSVGTGNKRVAEHMGKYAVTNCDDLIKLCRDYNVKVACIDIGPEQVLANNFQRIALENGIFIVYRVKYKGKGKNRDLEINDVDGIVTVDRSESLEMTRSNLMLGMNVLPTNYEDIFNGVYKKEMLASYETLVTKTDGSSVKKWLNKEDDHQFHADNYDRLAFKIMTENSLTLDDIYIG